MAVYNLWMRTGGRRARRIAWGFQILPNDRGNWTGGDIGVGVLAGTNMSISAYALAGQYPPGTVTEQFMRGLTKAFAVSWYKPNVWDKVLGDQIQSQNVADFFADMFSSMGYNAIKYMQRALNSVGESVVVDNLMGPQTLTALNRQIGINEARIYNAFHAQVTDHYHRAAQKPGNGPFLENWINSLNKDYPPMPQTSSSGPATLLLLGLGGAILYQGLKRA